MKKILALLMAVVMVFALAACAPAGSEESKGNDTTAPAGPQDITLKVWSPAEDQGSNQDGWLWTRLKAFEEANKDKYNITWTVEVCSEGDAGNKVKADPAAAGDVYFYANDQIGTLVQAQALAPIGGSYAEQVKNNNSQTLIDSVTYSDGMVYGFPMSNNTWFMFYNKDIFTEEDVKSLDTMVSKAKVAFPFGTGWYTGAFILGNGGTIFGPNGIDADAGFDFGGQKGYDATKAMVDLVATGNLVDDASGLGIAGLKDGSIGAMFTGDWDYQSADPEKPGLKDVLGDKLGVVALPTFKCAGKDVQLKSFAGSKCVGVNPNAKNMKAAVELAAFLASDESQLARYEMRGVIPAAKNLANNDKIKSNELAIAQMNTMNNTSVAQPILPEMANYWAPMGTFGGAVANGDVNADNYKEQVDLLNDSLNQTGL